MGTMPQSSSIDNAAIRRVISVDVNGNEVTSGSEYTPDTPFVGTENGSIIRGIRQDAQGSPVASDGALHPFVFNEAGRLKTAGAPAYYDPVVMAVSAVQAAANTPVANATAFAEVSQISNIMAYVTGTFAAMNCIFEGSLDSTNGTDGTWFGIQAVRSNANTVETTTGSLSAAPVYAWEMSVNALRWVRVRCTARTSGTQNWRFVLGSYATEPIPATQTHAVTQSGTFTITPLTPTSYNLNSAATTNAVSMKASAGTLFSLNAYNYSASIRYLKLYNKASAPTVGTDVPILVVPLPADSIINIDTGALGMRFATGIAFAITGGEADNDTTAILAGDIKLKADYV